MEAFEKWLAEDIGCSLEGARRYAEKHPHMVKCWQAATLAERERCAEVAEETPFTMSMFLRKEECKAAVSAQKVIAAAIRKGEGV